MAARRWRNKKVQLFTVSCASGARVSRLSVCRRRQFTRSNFYQPSSHIALVYQSFCCRTIADRLYYDWIAEKIWTTGGVVFISSHFASPRQTDRHLVLQSLAQLIARPAHAWNKTTQRKFLEFVRNGINIGTYVRIICNSFNNCIFLAALFWLDRRALF